jgi:hypothetical protein
MKFCFHHLLFCVCKVNCSLYFLEREALHPFFKILCFSPLSPHSVAVLGEEGRLPSSHPFLFFPHVFFSFPLPLWVLRVYLFLGCSSRWLGLLQLVLVSSVDVVSVVGRYAVVRGFWSFCILGCRSTVFGSS